MLHMMMVRCPLQASHVGGWSVPVPPSVGFDPLAVVIGKALTELPTTSPPSEVWTIIRPVIGDFETLV